MYKETEQDIVNRQKAESRLSREGRKYFKFIEFDAKEELVTEVRKHPFGFYVIVATGILLSVAMFAIGILGAFINLDSIGIEGANGIKPFITLISLILILGTMVMTYIATFLYKSNVIFVTNEKIAQVLYMSLFDRKISQLSIGDVQDVTVTQRGVMSHYFNYGTLTIETAGEQENYKFTYVPEPYQVSKLIVGAHERNLVEHGN